jgi:hypothetical protein
MHPLADRGTVFIIRDAQQCVKRAVVRREQAVAACKGRRGWSYEAVPDALTHRATVALDGPYRAAPADLWLDSL